MSDLRSAHDTKRTCVIQGALAVPPPYGIYYMESRPQGRVTNSDLSQIFNFL